MVTENSPTGRFIEIGPDHYKLTSRVSIALGAAWQVLQAFELKRYGELEFYTEDRRDNTLEYLRSGGEERPWAGIFAVTLCESFDVPNLSDLHVSNRNAPGDESYRDELRAAVESVDIASN